MPTSLTEQQHVIGYVVFVENNVKASFEGLERELIIGDSLYPDDTLITGEDSYIQIEFTNGLTMDVGSNTTMTLDADVVGYATDVVDNTSTVEDVQAAILAGADPLELEATASGGEPQSNEGSTVVLLDRSDDQTTPESGLDTTGLAQDVPELPLPADILVEETILVDAEGSTEVEDDCQDVIEDFFDLLGTDEPITMDDISAYINCLISEYNDNMIV